MPITILVADVHIFVYVFIHLARVAWHGYGSDDVSNSFPVHHSFDCPFDISFLSSISQLSLFLWDECALGAEDSGDTTWLHTVAMACITSLLLLHMQLPLLTSWSSSPLSRTALRLKKWLSLASAFWASTISFTARRGISSSSLRFATT